MVQFCAEKVTDSTCHIGLWQNFGQGLICSRIDPIGKLLPVNAAVVEVAQAAADSLGKVVHQWLSTVDRSLKLQKHSQIVDALFNMHAALRPHGSVECLGKKGVTCWLTTALMLGSCSICRAAKAACKGKASHSQFFWCIAEF